MAEINGELNPQATLLSLSTSWVIVIVQEASGVVLPFAPIVKGKLTVVVVNAGIVTLNTIVLVLGLMA